MGSGRYAVPVASWLGARGRLDVLDLQAEMLALTMRRVRANNLVNVVPTRGDAAALPYPDGVFDAAYLVSTLGQVPDAPAALRELRRVLRPGGRVVVGELCYDPHGVFFGTLRHARTSPDYTSSAASAAGRATSPHPHGVNGEGRQAITLAGATIAPPHPGRSRPRRRRRTCQCSPLIATAIDTARSTLPPVYRSSTGAARWRGHACQRTSPSTMAAVAPSPTARATAIDASCCGCT